MDKQIFLDTTDEISALVGDTNLFISPAEENSTGNVGEIEIMIAEESARRKGFGWETTLLMLKYALENLPIASFVAKIAFKNIKSVHLFTKLGFEEESRSDAFNEITYRKPVNEEWKAEINRLLGSENLLVEPFRSSSS